MTPPIRMVSVPVDELAQEIRRVDGNHSLGAGALAEALLPFLSRFTAAPVREEGGAVEVKPLDWRKPSEFDRDNGHENAELIASGFGGTYAIQRDLANVILWRVDDPFTFDTLPTIEAAKAHAEADWRQTISRKITLATREEATAEAGDVDLYDDKVQAGIVWTMRQWGEALGLKAWDMGDGSESVEGDVGAEIHTILVDAGLRDPETNEMAVLRAQPQAREEAQPVSLAECPPGLFMWNGTLGFKTQYGAMEPVGSNFKTWQVGKRADAYCAESGEYFWGGTSNHDDRAKVLVRPVTTPPAPEAEKLRAAVEALEQWKCGSCGGGKYLNRTKSGSEKVTCKVCNGSGRHPVATKALAALQQEGRGRD